MRTFAPQHPSVGTSKRQYVPIHHEPVTKIYNLSTFSLSTPKLQRKPSCACGGDCPRCQEAALLQTKPYISEPGDQYEQEAERIADLVMNTPPESQIDQTISNGDRGQEEIIHANKIIPSIQRQAAEEEQEPQRGDEEPTEEELEELEASNVAPLAQRKVEPGTDKLSNNEQVILQKALERQHRGSPLQTETRQVMESRLGHDFSKVRIHTDNQAHQAAKTTHARAFTVGEDIWFARGEFSPHTSSGLHLLTHELVHTIQQRSSSTPNLYQTIQRSICPSACEEPVSSGCGGLCRSDEVTRDNCGTSDAVNPDNKISHIRVVLADRQVTLFWNGTPKTAEGTSEVHNCTPNSDSTPTGWDTVGVKCGVSHTSWKRYNMAWFTGFSSHGYRFGFHNSQPLGSSCHSSGCVRVSCEVADKINKHSSSGWTSIIVR
ncbi:MAG: DUF4157 domain-containing protein [Cyanomargarita calcarea GSE-NOS-MK-12-04C]|jgi:hypothetical protein|uniref:DUF4157 domain-containing protein n=1 Tax=Cyanomargarita calcarea GSE-NOS-MK-12-04C TaxID=2839659 RepID=A0A951QU90_9CYAN|nr:DUF4157 domain-containing protein [Cyanomargarita calcarea GSE-NOS-MK-12-04C]